MIDRCSLCGLRGPVDLHHITGRPAPDAGYFDPALTNALCRACHATEHAGLRVLGLGFPRPDADVAAHRLFRVAAHLSGIADAGRPFVLGPASGRGLVTLLRECADVLDLHRTETPA